MKLTMQLGSRSYDIILKSGCLANLYQFANVANRKVFILTDSGVPAQYAQTVLAQCPNGMVYTVPQGEASKSLKGGKHEKKIRGICVNRFGGSLVRLFCCPKRCAPK